MSDELKTYENAVDEVDQHDEWDPGSIAKLGTGGALGAYLTGKFGKRSLARMIDTLGFGGNVSGSYASEGKVSQGINNLFGAGGSKRRNMLFQAIKTLGPNAQPAELLAAKNSLQEMESWMSKHLSNPKPSVADKRLYAKMYDYHLNLSNMMPKRRMAQAILQRSMKQPINFKHGGKFIEGTYPQKDPFIKKIFEDKGLSTKKPIPIYDVTAYKTKVKDPKTGKMKDKWVNKKYISDVKGLSNRDPRVVYIRDLLAQGKFKEAKIAAKKGYMYSGKRGSSIIRARGDRTGISRLSSKVKLIDHKNGTYTIRMVPHFKANRAGWMKPSKEFVVGGHTQEINFKPIKGLPGVHRATGRLIDPTTYVSSGETLKSASGVGGKARVLMGGRVGQAVGVHQPVVTLGTWEYEPPGRGRPVGATSTYSKSGKYVGATVKTVYKPTIGQDIKALLSKTNKKKFLTKLIPSLARLIFSKGTRF